MKKFSILFIVLCVSSQLVFAQSKSVAEQVAATAMAKLWKDPIGADTAKPGKWTYDQGVVLLGIERLWIKTANPIFESFK